MMVYDEQKQIDLLIELYRQGFEEILNVLKFKKGSVSWERFKKSILLDIYSVLSQLDGYTDDWIVQVIGQVYSQSAAQAMSYLSDMGIPKAADVSLLHQREIDIIGQNMSNNLHDAFNFMGRNVNDMFRQISLEEASRKYIQKETVQDMRRKLTQRLLEQGQTVFADRLGRQWRLDNYAKMVARTTTREAATRATLNECKEYGVDLVLISTHYPTCGICAPLQGKVFSISGQDERYPKLKEEYTPPVHPNCRHVLNPYIRELDDDADNMQMQSNTSLEKDPRTFKEREDYKAMINKA